MADLSAVKSYLAGKGRGKRDCCTLLADWLVDNGLPDPMADRRGSYSTATEYRSALKSEGGIVQSCSDRLAKIGLCETADPRSGDVALVLAPIGRRRDGRFVFYPTGALCVSDKWRAVLTSDGIAIASFPVVKAWSV